MALEKIATSNNEQQEAFRKPTTKTEVSNSIDYNLKEINEEKFNKFKEMTDYIKENGGEYWDEYRDIVNRIITPFEEKFQSIINKETKDLDSLSDEELNNIANERMKKHPEELMKQKEVIRKINNNGSPEEIQQLNEMVNENMVDVQNFYSKIMNNANWVTMPWESEPVSAPNTEPDSTIPEHWGEWNSGSEWWEWWID